MAQWSRAQAALSEDPGSFPTPTQQTICNSTTRWSDTNVHKIKLFFFFKDGQAARSTCYFKGPGLAPGTWFTEHS